MAFPFRGKKNRLDRKRNDRIRGRLERHKIENKNFKRNINVISECRISDPTDYLIVEFNFYEKRYSAEKFAKILSERLGDLF